MAEKVVSLLPALALPYKQEQPGGEQVVKKSSGKKVGNNSPVKPVLIALPSLKDSLLSPTLFAEQVKKLYPLAFVETEKVKRGEDPDHMADPQGTVTRRVALAVEEMLKCARALNFPEEIARFREVAKRARQKTRISFSDGGEEYELYLWFLSFHICGRWLEGGEKTVFINLPPALGLCPFFFLGQWWVRFLAHAAYWNGEDGTIMRIICGSGRGKRSVHTRTTQAKRNTNIITEIKRLKSQGYEFKEATEIVAKERHLSVARIIGIYNYPSGYSRRKKLARELSLKIDLRNTPN